MSTPDQHQYDQWHDDPANWKWGIFYYNKADKRIFPPKKFKSMGWTINFANPISVGAFVILFVGALVLVRFLSGKF